MLKALLTAAVLNAATLSTDAAHGRELDTEKPITIDVGELRGCTKAGTKQPSTVVTYHPKFKVFPYKGASDEEKVKLKEEATAALRVAWQAVLNVNTSLNMWSDIAAQWKGRTDGKVAKTFAFAAKESYGITPEQLDISGSTPVIHWASTRCPK